MRGLPRFFVIVFILSLGATAAAYAWRVYLPEGAAVRAERPTRSMGSPDSTQPMPQASGERAPYSSQPSGRRPSDRQDWAVTISILSSVISALAALVQTWLTARAMPPARRVGE
jgi:hypothetical protein